MAERPTVPPEQLFPRRLAWRALGMVLDQYDLRAMAMKLNPDDPSQALPGASRGEVSFYEDFAGGRGVVIATVLLDGPSARVLVERIDLLIRRNHRREFKAEEVGIFRRAGAPDIDVVLDVGEVVEVEGELLRTAKQRVLGPGSRPYRPARVIRAFGSSR